MSEIKLCKDCRYFSAESEECGHATAIKVSMVTGERTFYRAETQRTSILTEDCGVSAQYFQPKLSEAA